MASREPRELGLLPGWGQEGVMQRGQRGCGVDVGQARKGL